MKKIELLAPARDVETARAAILCGADSVYIGAPAFGARSAAANEVGDIAELCNFAHLYGCKVCVALNTILSEAELPRAAKLARELYDAGADSLIVQDMGLVEYGLPPMPLHASTQCHTTTPEKAQFLADSGFDTVVLARELSLEEIRKIAEKTDAKIECFAHGALCVSYSGQCRLSYAIGGRSGNRGECAQPCRMEYDLLDANGRRIAPSAHYLSLRDMNRSASLGEMLDAGVDIFKIEGRLKDVRYVKNITALYRRALDSKLAERDMKKASYGESEISFEPSASKSFSRGFCEYHLRGTQSGCAAFDTPKSRGEKIGVAKRSATGGFEIENASKIFACGDGLSFEYDGQTFGASVRKIDGDRVWVGLPDEDFYVPKGSQIFRNKNTAFEKSLDGKCARRMAVEISVSETADAYVFIMKTLDDRNASAKVALKKSDAQIAESPAAAEKLRENLSKLGNTPFRADSVKVETQNVPFLRASQINETRRELADCLCADILKKYDILRKKYIPRPRKKTDFSQSVPPFATDSFANVLNPSAKKFYEDIGVKISEPACESGKIPMRGQKVMTTKHCILREMGLCKKTSKKRFDEPLYLRNESALLRLNFDCARCGMDIFFGQ